MLKLVCLIIVSVLLGSCIKTPTKAEALQERVNQFESHIIYVKDTRTNMCFAVVLYSEYSFDYRSMTCVPCGNIPECLMETKDLK